MLSFTHRIDIELVTVSSFVFDERSKDEASLI